MPLISILIPVFNVEKYLNECLDSLVNQTLRDIEIICVNDGSTDNSLKILQDYAQKDERIKIIDKKNSGYGASMNIALNSSRGQYIGIVEPDDFVSLNMFEELYKKITENNCDIVKSDFYSYNSTKGQTIKFSEIEKYKTNKVISAKKYPKILNIIPSIWSAIYKKDFLERNNIKFLETPGASFQDTSFNLKALMGAKRVLFVPEAYLFYRVDNATSSVKNKGKIYFVCKEFEEVHKYINEHKELEEFRQLIYAKQFEVYCWNFSRIDKAFDEEFFEYFYKQFRKYYDENLIKPDFYSHLREKYNFKLFINSPEKFYKKLVRAKRKAHFDDFRRNLISIRINLRQISVILFGKQIVRVN
ncbi:glycosyltransferase [bacterium]|nr:glycosyltransferase [bacterium]